MVKIKTYKDNGAPADEIEFDETVFGDKVKRKLMKEVVLMHEANRRQGTASTKTRGDRTGSGAKPWRQKGTGRARVGSVRSPLWRGGGVIHGPKPKDWSYEIPRKAKKEALRCAVLSKFTDNEVSVIESINIGDKPKTKVFADITKKIGLDGKVLFVIPEYDEKIYKSIRNLEGVAVDSVANLHTWQVLRYKYMVVTKAALDILKERLVK